MDFKKNIVMDGDMMLDKRTGMVLDHKVDSKKKNGKTSFRLIL